MASSGRRDSGTCSVVTQRVGVDQGLPLAAEATVSPEPLSHSDVPAAITAVAAGLPVVVVDDDHDCGDVVFAAETATTALMAFTVRYTSGFVCVALPGEQCDRLGLPPIDPCSHDELAYRVAVDVRDNGTGISAAARARTAVALSDAGSSPSDFVRPGHVLPVEARAGGVLERSGHAEAALDLARLAGRQPAAVLSTVISDRWSGETAGRAELDEFARRHGMRAISIAALVDYRRRTEHQVRCVGTETITTAEGDVHVLVFRRLGGDGSHLAFLAGAVHPKVPVYIHTECLSGDVVGLTTCRCESDLRRRLATFAGRRDGIVVYVRRSGPPWTCDRFGEMDRSKRGAVNRVAAEILSELSVTSVRLLDQDDDLADVLRKFGVSVDDT